MGNIQRGKTRQVRTVAKAAKLALLLSVTLGFLGCSEQTPAERHTTQPNTHWPAWLWSPDHPVQEVPTQGSFVAARSDTPLTIDGQLDEPVWKQASTYKLTEPGPGSGQTERHPDEPGRAMLAMDNQFLYVALSVRDRDIVQSDDRDHQHHYRTGDVLEVFIKPEVNDVKTSYFELYATPHGRKTMFLYRPGARLGMPDVRTDSALRVAAQLQGTLNDSSDTDTGWTVELAIPLSEIQTLIPEAHQQAPATWTALVGRYNTDHAGNTQITAAPQLEKTFFHEPEHWAVILSEQ